MWTPPEFATLQETCDAVHEYFESLLRAGFTRHEALHIVLGSPCCERSP